MQKPIKISIDTITGQTVSNYNNIRKGDTLLMSISMYQNSASLNLTGQTVHVILAKLDGYSVEKIITGLTSNIIAIAFDEQATICIGEVIGEVQVIDANGCSISNHFTYEVGATNADNVIIASKNELDTLAKIQAVIDNYNANVTELTYQNNLATTNIATLISDNAIGITTCERLEADIVTGTEVAVRLENDITTGNALDVILKSDIANGTTVNNNLILSITNANEAKAQLVNMNWATIQSYIDLMNIMLSGMTITDENNLDITDENDIVITI